MTALRTVDALRNERIALADDLAEARRLAGMLEAVRERAEKRRSLVNFLAEELALEIMEEVHAGVFILPEARV